MSELSPMAALSALSVDTKVVLLGILNALLITTGVVFQKFATRGGSVLGNAWTIAALAAYLPTFFIGNLAFAIGGRASVFVPVTALTYVLVTIAGKLLFGESVGAPNVAGIALIVAGVAFIARA